MFLLIMKWSPLEFLGVEWRIMTDMALFTGALIGTLLLLIRGIRGKEGLRSTLRAWFRPDGLRRGILGLVLALPIVILVAAVQGPGSLRVPFTDSHESWHASYSVLLAPILEETVFRGFLLGVLLLDGRANPWVALVVVSLLDGAGHLNPYNLNLPGGAATVLYHSSVAAFLGWTFWRRASDLCFPIGFHLGINLSSRFVDAHAVAGPSWLAPIPWTAVLVTCGIAFAFLRSREGKESPLGSLPLTES